VGYTVSNAKAILKRLPLATFFVVIDKIYRRLFTSIPARHSRTGDKHEKGSTVVLNFTILLLFRGYYWWFNDLNSCLSKYAGLINQ
jgi:hypothetical protein